MSTFCCNKTNKYFGAKIPTNGVFSILCCKKSKTFQQREHCKYFVANKSNKWSIANILLQKIQQMAHCQYVVAKNPTNGVLSIFCCKKDPTNCVLSILSINHVQLANCPLTVRPVIGPSICVYYRGCRGRGIKVVYTPWWSPPTEEEDYEKLWICSSWQRKNILAP